MLQHTCTMTHVRFPRHQSLDFGVAFEMRRSACTWMWTSATFAGKGMRHSASECACHTSSDMPSHAARVKANIGLAAPEQSNLIFVGHQQDAGTDGRGKKASTRTPQDLGNQLIHNMFRPRGEAYSWVSRPLSSHSFSESHRREG